MAGYTVGSLFSGYGGLDLGVMGALGPGDTLFVSDVEKGHVRCFLAGSRTLPILATLLAWTGVKYRELMFCVGVLLARTCQWLAREPA